jgi:peptidoglycan/xylan/chitin deacetylase (PgdA/CDA1 family)
MTNSKNKNYYRLLFFGSVIGFLVATIFIVNSSKLFLNKNDYIPKPQTITHYDPNDSSTPNKIFSITEKKDYRIPIIMYHYVEYVKDPLDTIRKSLDINPFVFEKELEALNQNHYQTLFVKELPKILSGEMSYSSKSAVLTFDDGYEDFYTDVLPLLKEYQIKATVYIVYNFIGQKGFLNEKEIKEIIDSKLVEIGSHTLDHLYLKKLSQSVITEQVVDSKKMLEDKFNIKVETFAYPYGAFNQDTADLVRSAGYTTAVAVMSGIKQSEKNLFYLYRIRAGSFSYGNMIKFFDNYQNK